MADTVSQRIEFPTEVQPFASELYQTIVPQFQKTFAAGYRRPTTPLVTPFAEEEKEAMSGLSSLARGPGAAPSYQFGQRMLEMGAAPIGQADISRLMSPYMSGVTEAAKRRAAEEFQRQTLQPLMTQATSAGGLRGARAAVERGLAYEGLGRTLSDIESAGLQKAYEQALTSAQAEKTRMISAAPGYAQLGSGGFEADVQRFGTLSSVGETQRNLADALRQAEFSQEEADIQFPEAALSRYYQFLGNPSTLESRQASQSAQPAKPSGLSSALGTGISLLGNAPKAVQGAQSIIGGVGDAYNWLTGLFNAGGRVGGGLSSLVRRAEGGPLISDAQIKALQQAAIAQATQSYLAEMIAEQKRKAAEQQKLQDSWSYQLFGVTDPDRTAIEAERISQAIMQPTEKETRLGQAFEAINRGIVAKSAEDIAYEKEQVARRATKKKATQEQLKSTLDISKEMREASKAEYEPLIDLYAAESRTLSALAAQPGSDPQIQAMIPRLTSLRDLIFEKTGINVGGMNQAAPPPPPPPAATGGARSSAPISAAEEVLKSAQGG